KTSRCNALRLSAWEGRRGLLSQGLALRSTRSPSALPQAHASTRLCSHRHRLKQPSPLWTLRTCCWPAPQTSLASLKVCSSAGGSAAASSPWAGLACGSVQKNGTQPLGWPSSLTSTTRRAPPAGRHVATNDLTCLVTRWPYWTHSTSCQPRAC